MDGRNHNSDERLLTVSLIHDNVPTGSTVGIITAAKSHDSVMVFSNMLEFLSVNRFNFKKLVSRSRTPSSAPRWW